MPGIDDYNKEGELIIDTESMNRPAWAILGDETGQGGLLPLLYKMQKRGGDRIIPGAAGVIAYPRRATATPHSLRLAVTGDVDEDGVATADSAVGLAANMVYLFDNVLSNPMPLAASLTCFGQSVSGDIHVVDLIEDRYNVEGVAGINSSIFVGTLRIEVLAGILV